MRRVTFIALLGLVAISAVTFAQQRTLDPNRIETSLSVGPSVAFFRTPRAPQSAESHDFGGGSMLRVMWHPGRLLAFGLSTGYILLSQENLEVTDGSVTTAQTTLSAIPLQLCASMQKGGLEIGFGVGPYIMRSTISDEEYSSASRMELGLTGFGSYDVVMGEHLRTGPAIRCIYMDYRGVLTIIPEWRVRYDLVLD